MEYRHQIQSYTCEIDALKGTVSQSPCHLQDTLSPAVLIHFTSSLWPPSLPTNPRSENMGEGLKRHCSGQGAYFACIQSELDPCHPLGFLRTGLTRSDQ